MRVLIADDIPAVRSAIRILLKEEKDVQIVGEAANLGELFTLTRLSLPDLILMDWELSGFPGSAKISHHPTSVLSSSEKKRNIIIASLRKCPSQPLIIVLSSYPEAEAISLSAGASAFIFKGDPPEKLIHTIRTLSTLT